MKSDQCWMWSGDCPEGQMFDVEDLEGLGDEWVDSPAKLEGAPENASDITVLADMLAGYRQGDTGWLKAQFVRMLNMLTGGDMPEDTNTTIKEIRKQIEASLTAWADVIPPEVDHEGAAKIILTSSEEE